MCLESYVKMAAGTFCPDIKFEIKDENDCKEAATRLGLTWAMSWTGPNDSPACFYDTNNGGSVFFNLSPNPDRASMLARRSPICKIDGKNSHHRKISCNNVLIKQIYYLCNFKVKKTTCHSPIIIF